MDMRKCTAEAIGTFWLTFAGCGSAVLAAAFPQPHAMVAPKSSHASVLRAPLDGKVTKRCQTRVSCALRANSTAQGGRTAGRIVPEHSPKPMR
jgi:hypothetical protein